MSDGKVAVVTQRPGVTPPKKSGPEDLPVEYYTPKPYTLGPHEEPGYEPPTPVTKSKSSGRTPQPSKSGEDAPDEIATHKPVMPELHEEGDVVIPVKQTSFKTQHGAAEHVSREINSKSISENREYGGMIYQNEDGTYGYTGPIEGSIDGVDPGDPASIPKGKVPVAYWHTHGGDDPIYDNENFSNVYDPVDKEWYGDIPYADENKIDGYLATPKGKFKYYSYKNNQVEFLGDL